jgi:hypothetical protein
VKPNEPVSAAMYSFNTKRPYKEITEDTKLVDLQRFFEKNSSAIITTVVGAGDARCPAGTGVAHDPGPALDPRQEPCGVRHCCDGDVLPTCVTGVRPIADAAA